MSRPIIAALVLLACFAPAMAQYYAPNPYALTPMPPANPVPMVLPRTSLPSWVPQPLPPSDPSYRIIPPNFQIPPLPPIVPIAPAPSR